MSKCLFFILLFSYTALLSEAQVQELTMDSALKAGLQNNFNIRLAKKNMEISSLQNTIGNAGFLPSVDLRGSTNNSANNIRQQFINGEENNRNGAKSSSFGGSVDLNWTLFDGFEMFYRKDELELREEQSIVSLETEIRQTSTEIINSFLNVALTQQELVSYQSILEASGKQVKIARLKWKSGNGSRLELMRLQADFNSDSIAFVQAKVRHQSNLILLARLTQIENIESVSTNFGFNLDSAPYNELLEKLYDNNNNLQLARNRLSLAQNAIKQNQSTNYPDIGLNLGYDFLESESEAGFLASNRNYGWNYGFSLNYNLFNGLQSRNTIEVARENLNYESLLTELITIEEEDKLQQAYIEYDSYQSLLELSNENLEISESNYQLILEEYELGSTDYLDVLNAKEQLERSLVQYYTIQADLLRSIAEIKRLCGLF